MNITPERLAELNTAEMNTRETHETFAGQLAALRKEFDEVVAQMEQQWRAANAELITQTAAAKAERDKAEAALREAAVARYEQQPKGPKAKQVAPALGLSVRVTDRFVITDKEKAKEWGKTHPDFLILDEAAVIEAGKNPTVAASLGIDFVENQPKISAVIGEPKAEKKQEGAED